MDSDEPLRDESLSQTKVWEQLPPARRARVTRLLTQMAYKIVVGRSQQRHEELGDDRSDQGSNADSVTTKV
jgi:hypothetical protein